MVASLPTPSKTRQPMRASDPTTLNGSDEDNKTDLHPYSQLSVGDLCALLTRQRGIDALRIKYAPEHSDSDSTVSSTDSAILTRLSRPTRHPITVPPPITEIWVPTILTASARNSGTHDASSIPVPSHTRDTLYLLGQKVGETRGKRVYGFHTTRYKESGNTDSLLSRTNLDVSRRLWDPTKYWDSRDSGVNVFSGSPKASLLISYRTPVENVSDIGSWVSGREIEQGRTNDGAAIEPYTQQVIKSLF